FINTSTGMQNLFASKPEIKEEKSSGQLQKIDSIKTVQAASQNYTSYELPTQDSSGWEQRMSQFKAMQINYESNLIYANRMGRLEQIEIQLGFPLALEALWNEISFYEKNVAATLQYNTNLSLQFENYLKSELDRIQKLQIYIWQKMAQYFID